MKTNINELFPGGQCWAVCYTIPADTQDDKTEKRQTVAVFSDPWQAQDFIEKIMPTENKSRFYILPINF